MQTKTATELETKMLHAIATDLMTPLNGAIPTECEDATTYTDIPEWALSMKITEPQAKGVLGSLTAKGLVEHTEGDARIGDPDGVNLTDEGFAIFRASLEEKKADVEDVEDLLEDFGQVTDKRLEPRFPNCPNCETRFRASSWHRGIKKYKCESCGKTYTKKDGDEELVEQRITIVGGGDCTCWIIRDLCAVHGGL